jgi:hypothetical protein
MSATATGTVSSSPKPKPVTPRRRRWLLLLIAAGGLLGGVVAAAPSIVAEVPELRQEVVRFLLPGFEGHVEFGKVSLGWNSPIRCTNVVVHDSAGDKFLEVGGLVSESTLWELLRDYQHAGRFTAEHPTLTLALRADGSNVEDALAPLLAGEGESDPIGFIVEVREGTVVVTDVEANHNVQWDHVDFTWEQPFDPAAPRKAEFYLQVLDDTPNSLRGTYSSQVAEGSVDSSSRLTLKAQAFPLEAVQAVVRRVRSDVRLSGLLTSDLQGGWNSGEQRFVTAFAGLLQLRDARLTLPGINSHDTLQLAVLDASGAVEYDNGVLQLDGVKVTSDLGQLDGNGTVNLQVLQETGSLAERWQRALATDEFHCQGELDLARWATTLPETLKIRNQARLESGKIRWNLQGRPQSEKQTTLWSGDLNLDQLAGTFDGQPVKWGQPLTLEFQMQQTPGGLTVDRLACESTFLQVLGKGDARQATLTARCDLDQFARELSQVVDFGKLRVAGMLNADARYAVHDDGSMSGTGHLLVEEFQLVIPGQRPWHEKRLTIDLTARGTARNGKPEQITAGELNLTSGTDTLRGKLLEPVSLTAAAATWPINLNVAGELATWLPRLEPWLTLPGYDLTGTVAAGGALRVSEEELVTPQFDVDIARFRLQGPSLSIDEPQVQVRLAGQWNIRQVSGEAATATLACQSIALRGTNLKWHSEPAGLPTVTGELAVRSDLGKLGRWWKTGPNESPYSLSGMAEGQLDLAQRDQVCEARWNLGIQGLAAVERAVNGAPAVNRWAEDRMSLAGQATYDRQKDLLTLTQADVGAQGLVVHARGTVSDLSGRRMTDLSGQLEYDLAQLVDRFRGYLGKNVQMTGRQSRPFSLKGPLASLTASPSSPALPGQPQTTPSATAPAAAGVPLDEMTAQAAIAWTSANFYGLTASEGEVAGQLAKGVVQFKPFDLAVSEGRVRLEPRLQLQPGPALLFLNQGLAIDKVRLSPELCENWLKFVAPLVAEATQADGRFSVTLTGGNVPLALPRQADIGGQVTIHTAQVRPGPLAQQFVGIAENITAIVERRPAKTIDTSKAVLTIENQAIEFRVLDGRVHHRNLSFRVGDVVLRTKGSVGFDETLQLVVEVPIQDQWIEREKALSGLKGQVVQVPITGTFQQPQVDPRSLGDLARKLGGAAVEGAIKNELQKQLDKLFRRKD